MNIKICPLCGHKMKKNGRTSAGKIRYRCTSCGASTTTKIDSSAKNLKIFLRWLFSKQRQSDMAGSGRTFRRKTRAFWNIWPLPPKVDTSYRVIYLDGIYLARKACVLIATSDEYVLGWYLCRAENSRAWSSLMTRIAEPAMVVSDGGSGFGKALKRVWPHTKHQRCLFHASSQVRRYTTLHPETQAGVDLLALASLLCNITTLKEADAWMDKFQGWSYTYKDFLKETTRDAKGRLRPTHENVVKAANSLTRLIRANTLFTYLDPELTEKGPLPKTNNRIEGGVNAQLRVMLKEHRGLSLERRIKAVFWWCYMHSPHPSPAKEILKVMPTDRSIKAIYDRLQEDEKLSESIPRWGDAIVWSELHHSVPYRMDWD